MHVLSLKKQILNNIELSKSTVTAESELVLCLFSDVMPCSMVRETMIKNHHGDNLKTLTSLWFSLNTSAGIQNTNTLNCLLKCILIRHTPTK